MTTTRRDVLKGMAAAPVVLALPIPGLTPVVTLEQLAAEGKFASSDHDLPETIYSHNFTFYLNGVEQREIFVRQIYAPGDDTGWAVVCETKSKGFHKDPWYTVRGNWTFKSEPVEA